MLNPTDQDKRHGATRIEPNADDTFLSKYPAGGKPVASSSHAALRATHSGAGSSSGAGGGGSISIAGTIAQGETVSLSPVSGGCGSFGGRVLQYAKGDEAASGTAIQGVSASIGNTLSTFIIGLGSDTAGDHLRFSDAVTRPGRSMSLMRAGEDSGGNHRNGGFGYGTDESPQLFISYWRYWSSGSYTVADVNIKQYYVFGNGDDGPTNEKPQPILHVPAGNSSWAMGPNTGAADPNISNTESWQLGADSENQWQRWDSWLVLNTPGVQDGVARVWRGRVLGIVDDSYAWQDGFDIDATAFKNVRLGYMDTNVPDPFIYHTDFYVSTSQARIEIGNAATWSACTHTEILPVPETSWADQSISGVVLDAGGLGSLTGLYLYVIKSDGTPFNENGEAL